MAPGTLTSTAPILVRTRLLEVLARRWTRRLITVTAGAGFGKSVLLEQATAENRLDCRGHDVVLRCGREHEAASRFAVALAEAAGVQGGESLDPAAVVDTVLTELGRWPAGPVAVIVDDAHHLDGRARRLLVRLVAEAPGNVHFVVASRRPIRGLAGVSTPGGTDEIDEGDLCLDHHELSELAASSGRDASSWQSLGGWPALVALAARFGGPASECWVNSAAIATEFTQHSQNSLTTEHVWETVLAELGPAGRLVLASLAAIGGGDADLLRAAMADPDLEPADLLAGVPLVTRRDGGWVAHDLWARIVGTVLDRDRLAATRCRAAEVLVRRGEHDRAFRLFALAHDWSSAAGVLRDACGRGFAGVPRSVLEGWLGLWPRARYDDAEGLLLRGLVRRARDPFGERTVQLLDAAATAFRDAGNVGGEVAANMELAYVARARGDVEVLPRLMMRAFELDAQGHHEVDGGMAIGRAALAEMAGDEERYVAELAAVPLDCLSVEWRAAVAFMEFTGYLTLGREEAMVDAARRCADLGGPAFTGRHAVAVAEWYAGRPDLALDTLDEIRRDRAASRVDQLTLGAFTTMVSATAGRLAEAREALAMAEAATVGSAHPLMTGYVAGARALVAAAEGDEAGATEALRGFLADVPLSDPAGRRAATRWLALVYVLLPEARGLLDEYECGPLHDLTLRGARALVAVRDGRRPSLDGVSLPIVATSMPLPWTLALASGAAHHDDPRGRQLAELVLARFGEDARAALRAVAAGGGPTIAAQGAKKLLADVPLPPAGAVRINVLGPAELLLDGHATSDAHWRRERVRALLLHLVCRGRARREQVADALWPDASVEAGGRSLRVTLSYLNRVLEPERRQGEAPFVVRQVGDELVLAPPPHVTIDLVEFEELLDRADDADRRGVPSAARDALERALPLWRGPCLGDVAYDEWAQDAVRRLERRFVDGSVRAAVLALAADSAPHAVRHAERALAVDEWCETAHRVLVAARLAAGDRLGAARALGRCEEMLGSLGVSPDRETEALRHRLRSA
jgi:DNA-binding SARP family transcriptional activator